MVTNKILVIAAFLVIFFCYNNAKAKSSNKSSTQGFEDNCGSMTISGTADIKGCKKKAYTQTVCAGGCLQKRVPNGKDDEDDEDDEDEDEDEDEIDWRKGTPTACRMCRTTNVTKKIITLSCPSRDGDVPFVYWNFENCICKKCRSIKLE